MHAVRLVALSPVWMQKTVTQLEKSDQLEALLADAPIEIRFAI